jgi:hypothetical protein
MNLSSIKPNFSTANTANTLVQRDAGGDIFVGDITATTFTGKLAPTVITGETAITDAASDDVVLLYDTSADRVRKITIDNLMRKINDVPYLEYAWVASPSTNYQEIPRNTWTTLTLTSKTFDPQSIGSAPSGNGVSLGAGTYDFEARFFAYPEQSTIVYFRLLAGSTQIENSTKEGNSIVNTNFNISGRFTIGSTTSISLQARFYSHDTNITLNVGEEFHRAYVGTIRDPRTVADSKRVVLKLWKLA